MECILMTFRVLCNRGNSYIPTKGRSVVPAISWRPVVESSASESEYRGRGSCGGGDSTLVSGVVAVYSRGELKNELEGKAVEGDRY